MIGAGDEYIAVFERLSERIEGLLREFRQFIQEQHALVREANFARLGPQTAADKRRHRGGMMRCAKRARACQTPTLQQSCN